MHKELRCRYVKIEQSSCCIRATWAVYIIICETYTSISFTAFILNFADLSVSLPAMVSVNEGVGQVQICATAQPLQETERNFSIMLSSRDNTGTMIGERSKPSTNSFQSRFEIYVCMYVYLCQRTSRSKVT